MYERTQRRAEHICNLKLILGKKETRRRYAGIAQRLVRQSSKLGMTVRFCLPAQSTLPVKTLCLTKKRMIQRGD